MSSFSAELKVPRDQSFGSLIRTFLTDACTRGGLQPQQTSDLIGAAQRVFAEIAAQDPGESAPFMRVAAECTPERLSIAFLERAIAPEIEHLDGIDEVHRRLHGVAGSEIALSMLRPHDHEAISAPQTAAVEEVEQAPEQEYVIRRFRDEDAEGVARAFYQTYGFHYPFSAVYVPERLCELNAAGRYVSIVAESAAGEIVAHYALHRDRAAAPIAEGGGAIVNPAHRGRNLLNRTRAKAEEEAIALGLAAYYTEPVTDHGRTQHASLSFGAVPCGVILGGASRDFLARQMELSTTTQRQSFMSYFKPLRPREERRIFVPTRHRDIVQRIYDGLRLPVKFARGARSRRRAHVGTSIERRDGTATIKVFQSGGDAAELVAQAARDLRSARKLGALYANLPLEDRGTPDLCEHLEQLGFYFSGVAPWTLAGGDALQLQRPLTALDLSALTVVGEFGQELLRYVASERERCSV